MGVNSVEQGQASIIGLFFNGHVSQRNQKPLIRGCGGSALVEVVEKIEEVSPSCGTSEGQQRGDKEGAVEVGGRERGNAELQDDEGGVEVAGGQTGGDGGTPKRHVESGGETMADEGRDVGDGTSGDGDAEEGQRGARRSR